MTYSELNINDDKDFGRLRGRIAYAEKADDTEKSVVKAGMTPVTLLEKVDLTIADLTGEFGRGFTLGLFDAAEEDGGMRV